MRAELKFTFFLFLLVFLLSLALIIFPWQKLTTPQGDKVHGAGDHHTMTAPTGKLEWGLILLSGLLGGAHCLGMCGGIVASYSFKLSHGRETGLGFLSHFLFNSGRAISYLIIGAAMGALGSLVMKNPWFHSFQGIVPLFLGLLMLFMALSLAGVLPGGLNIFTASFPAAGSGGIFERLMEKTLANNSTLSVFLLGLLVGFLPCGLVYAVAVKAAASGTWGGGALTMAVFGLGTWPALWVLGAASWKLSFFTTPQHRLWAYRLAAVSIALLGVLTLIRGIYFWI